MAYLTCVVLLAVVLSTVVAAPVDEVKITVVDLGFEPVPERPSGPGLSFIGDIQVDPHRNAVLNSGRWDNGLIYYVINSTFSSDIQNLIIKSMHEIEHDVNAPTGSACIKFVPRTTQINYIYVNPGTGCHSFVGMMDQGSQEVSIGTGCEFKGIIMHELIHAIGFWHEQSRTDRDNYVNINLTNVIDEDRFNFDLLTTSNSNNLNVPYDYGSIMHYEPYAFSIDKSIPVLTPKAGLDHGLKLGQTFALSKSDVTKIQRLYECTEDNSHITTPLQTNLLTACNFESGMCSLQNDGTADFQWEHKSGASSAGPKTGNTNGADSYLIATAAGHHGFARVITPSFNRGDVCIDFFLSQPGSTSHLNIIVFGPNLPRQTIKTYSNKEMNGWGHSRVNFSISQGASFQVVFEANIGSGDVAIDDLNIYHGQCV